MAIQHRATADTRHVRAPCSLPVPCQPSTGHSFLLAWPDLRNKVEARAPEKAERSVNHALPRVRDPAEWQERAQRKLVEYTREELGRQRPDPNMRAGNGMSLIC